MAAPAHLITLGLDSNLNKSIRAWFRDFNFLPPIPLTAGHIDTVTANVSFEDLLKRMVDSAFKNFILIIHGHSDGSGLHLNLAPHQTKMHTEYYDLQKLMEVDAGKSTMSKTDMARMGITKPHIDRILDLMHQVRNKKIDCIEFRSCNLGKNPLSLRTFREFFGARLAGAPDLHTVFGIVPVVIRPDFYKFHKRFHAGGGWETYNFPIAIADSPKEMMGPDLVCCFQLNELAKPEAGGHIATDTAAEVDKWIKKHIMPTGSFKGKEMAIHSLWVADQKVVSKDPKVKPRMVPVAIILEKEDLTDPLGGWGPSESVRRFVPPLSENYGKHIIYSR